MKRKQFFLQCEEDVQLNCYQWQSDEPEKASAVIQLAHGMAEHILRYEEFVKYLTAQNFIVYGHDHRGHGGSIIAPDDWGFFSDSNGFEKVVQDMHEINTIIHETHPGLPIILFGHSLGSFLARRYMQLHGLKVDGVILSGTGGRQGVLGKVGKFIADVEVKRIGPRTPSKLMNQLVFGNFNKFFEPADTPFDFLTRDHQAVRDYAKDKYCGFICAAQFYADLLSGINLIHQKQEVASIPSSLPVYLIAGDKDPVGNNGKGVREVQKQYVNAGMQQVSLTLYPNARHELLHEWNKHEVYEDIFLWMREIIKS